MTTNEDWDDGIVNHAASPDWNAGVTRKGASQTETLRAVDQLLTSALVLLSGIDVKPWIRDNIADALYELRRSPREDS
jgi:hypothetical protein